MTEQPEPQPNEIQPAEQPPAAEWIPRALSATLRPLHHLTANLPDPNALKWSLREQLETAYQAALAIRGEARLPEDTYDIQRALAAATDALKAYSGVFYDLRRYVSQLVEEQLIDAVGEQTRVVSETGNSGLPVYSGTGRPNQGLRIPDPAGDVVLSLDNANSYDIDVDQLVAAVIAATLSDDQQGERTPEQTLAAALVALLELGKFEPQVSKVRAYAAELSRSGDDATASVVTSAIRKTVTYKGVKYERK